MFSAPRRRPARPSQLPRWCCDACIVIVHPPAGYDKLFGSIGGLLNVAARRLTRALRAERRRARARAPPRSAARHGVRITRLSARRESKTREGFGPGASGGVLGGLGRRHRCDVDGGERRREVELRHDFDVPLLEAVRGAAGKVRRAAARRRFEVHVRDSCVGAARGERGVRDET